MGDNDEPNDLDTPDAPDDPEFAKAVIGVTPLKRGTEKVPRGRQRRSSYRRRQASGDSERAVAPWEALGVEGCGVHADKLGQTGPLTGHPLKPSNDKHSFQVEHLDGGCTAGRHTSLDKRTMKRLRRGENRIDSTLDLHGLNQTQAHNELTDFIARHRDRGSRVVRVVTGRGSNSSDGHGVLREQFPRWLTNAPFSGAVLGFSSAKPQDGGNGAFYVLLRSKKRC